MYPKTYEFFELDNYLKNDLQNYSTSLQNYFTDSNDTNYQNMMTSKSILENDSEELKNNVFTQTEEKNKNESITKDYYNKFNNNLEIINAQILGNKNISNKLATKDKILDLGHERYRYTTNLFWFFIILNIILVFVLVYLLK